MALVPAYLIFAVFINIIKRRVSLVIIPFYILEIYYIFIYRDTNISIKNYNGAINLVIAIYLIVFSIVVSIYKICKYIYSLKKIRVLIMIFNIIFIYRQIIFMKHSCS